MMSEKLPLELVRADLLDKESWATTMQVRHQKSLERPQYNAGLQ
jgi:hypothetical protein